MPKFEIRYKHTWLFCRYTFIVVTEQEVAAVGPIEAALEYVLRNVIYLHSINDKRQSVIHFPFLCILKEADMIGGLSALTLERSKKADFTFPVITGQYVLVEPMPGLKNRYFAPIKPFQPMVIIPFISTFK